MMKHCVLDSWYNFGMTSAKTKLKMHIKGKGRNIFAKSNLKKLSQKLDVSLLSFTLISKGTLLITVSGDKNKLFEIIRWGQGHFNVYFLLDTINFEFED
jgi:hypothetical protein